MPLYVKILIVLLALPLFSALWLAGRLEPASPIYPTVRLMVWLYPFYMLLSSWLAWKAWAERQAVTWILLAMEVLSTASIYILIARQ
ncbi:MAG: hypothetical protein K2H94_06815 [Duncaniella sp.]|nr:hypothetical protein [Duncaniella sp.]